MFRILALKMAVIDTVSIELRRIDAINILVDLAHNFVDLMSHAVLKGERYVLVLELCCHLFLDKL